MTLPLSVGLIQEDLFTANIAITVAYATVSFSRTYFYHKVFERFGIDDNFVRIGIKGISKLKSILFGDIKIRKNS